jgi:hypothetical protein
MLGKSIVSKAPQIQRGKLPGDRPAARNLLGKDVSNEDPDHSSSTQHGALPSIKGDQLQYCTGALQKRSRLRLSNHRRGPRMRDAAKYLHFLQQINASSTEECSCRLAVVRHYDGIASPAGNSSQFFVTSFQTKTVQPVTSPIPTIYRCFLLSMWFGIGLAKSIV